MKNLLSLLSLSLKLAIQVSYGQAQGNDAGLLAAPYPGAIAETNPGIKDASLKALYDARSRTFYSKDPVEKVKAHYTKLLGPFEETSAGYTYARDVIAFKDVVAMVEKRGGQVSEGGDSFYGGTFAGVTLFGKVNNNNYHYSVIKVFDNLEKSYLLRFQDADEGDPAKLQKRLEDPELKQLEARYEHLKWSYFVQTTEPKKDGGNGYCSMDETLFDKYFTDREQARTKELAEVQQKMTDATTKMQYDVAQKLGDRLMKLVQPDPKDEWTAATKCLEEMELNAYATKIVIDMHPSKWNLTPPKN